MSAGDSTKEKIGGSLSSALNIAYLDELLRCHGELSVEHLLAFEPVTVDDVSASFGSELPPQAMASLQRALTADAYASLFGAEENPIAGHEHSTVATNLSRVIVSAVNAMGSARHADKWLASRHPTLGNEAPISLATKPFGYKLVTGMLGFISNH